jgi:hypothetical protein
VRVARVALASNRQLFALFVVAFLFDRQHLALKEEEMSTVLLFNQKFLCLNSIIQDCFSVERQSRLTSTVIERPWAAGLQRLLNERPGLKKGKLAEMAGIRPGTISGILNQPIQPDTASLKALCLALSEWDRRGNPKAPDVEMWEFFVSDDQSRLLRMKAAQSTALVAPPLTPDEKTALVADVIELLSQRPELLRRKA